MSVNYSSSVNFQGQNLYVEQKSPVKSGVKGTLLGAAGLGAASLGYQKLVLSDSFKDSKVFNFIFNKAEKEGAKGKQGLFTKIIENISSIKDSGKINWGKAGKLALIGGAVFGILSIIKTSRQNRKAVEEAKSFGYYA